MARKKTNAKKQKGKLRRNIWEPPAEEVNVEKAIQAELLREYQYLETAPPEAVCYIFLEQGELMRGCACRGLNGFAHACCLQKYAKTAAESYSKVTWTKCVTCKQQFTGALELEMLAAFWRHYKDETSEASGVAHGCLGFRLRASNQKVAGQYLLDKAQGGELRRLSDGLYKAKDLIESYRVNEGINLLKPLETTAKIYDETYGQTDFHINVKRVLAEGYLRAGKYRAARKKARTMLRLSRQQKANDVHILKARDLYARAIGRSGYFDICRYMLIDVLDTAQRTYGNDHPITKDTKLVMAQYVFNILRKAEKLIDDDDDDLALDYATAGAVFLEKIQYDFDNATFIFGSFFKLIAVFTRLKFHADGERYTKMLFDRVCEHRKYYFSIYRCNFDFRQPFEEDLGFYPGVGDIVNQLPDIYPNLNLSFLSQLK